MDHMESPTPGFSFGMRLGCVREDHELSKSAMAKSVGVSPSTWGKYESDDSFPSAQTIANFCSVYHVNEEWLNTNIGSIYEEGYKPGDPLVEPVEYQQTVSDQAQKLRLQIMFTDKTEDEAAEMMAQLERYLNRKKRK